MRGNRAAITVANLAWQTTTKLFMIPLLNSSIYWMRFAALMLTNREDGAEGENRTLTGVTHTILSRARLPVPPLRQKTTPVSIPI